MELLEIKDEVEYAPEFGGNREAPEDARCVVVIVPMTAAELRKADEGQGRLGKGGSINYVKKANAIRAAVLTTCIKSVRGLALVRTIGGVRESAPITDAAGLVKHAPEGLLEELHDAIKDQSKLAEGDLGNSDLPLGS